MPIRTDRKGAIVVMESHHQDDGAFIGLTKYAADGSLRWSMTIPDAFASLQSFAINRRGDILVAAVYAGTIGDVRLIGLDQHGRTKWNIPAALGQHVAALTADDEGNFYTSGHGLVARYSTRN